jgi:ABC-2 type transport system permease protein
MFLRVAYTVWLRELTRFWRDKSRLISNLATPIIFMAFLGTGLNSIFSVPGTDNYMEFLAPGIIGMTLLFSSIFTGISVIWDRQFGFLREMLVAPASRLSIVVGKIAGSSTIVLINGILIFIIAIIFGAIPLSYLSAWGIFLAVVVCILISFIFVSVGLIIAARMQSMEGFQMIMSFLIMPVFILSGAFFPITNLPPWLGFLTKINPLSYGVDALRGALLQVNEMPMTLNMIVLILLGAIFVTIATLLFRNMEA